MSDQNSLFSDDIRRRESERRRKDLLWSVLSFLFHGAVLFSLVSFTPVKDIIKEKKQPSDAAKSLSADRLEEIARQLEEARVNELLKQIEAMQAVLHNMDMMKEELQQDYDKFAQESAENVKDQLKKVADEVEKQQQNAVAEQPNAQELVKQIDQAMKSDRTSAETAKQLAETANKLEREAAEKIATAQANAANALDRIQVQAEFAGYKKSAEFAEKVHEKQIEAARMQATAQNDAIDTANEVRWEAEAAKRIADAQKRLENAEKAKAENTQAKAENEQKREEAQKAREEINATAEKAKAEAATRREQAKEAEKQLRAEANKMYAEASKEKDAEKRTAAQKAAREVVAKADEQKKAAEQANKEFWTIDKERREKDQQETSKFHKANSAANDADRKLKHAERTIEEAKKTIAEQTQRKTELDRKAEAFLKRQNEKKLSDAKKVQEEIAKTIENLKKIIDSDTPELQKLVQENRQENQLVDQDTRQMQMVEAYEMAKKLEDAITESFKDIKATETAIQKKMSFDAAQKITDVAKPERIEADKQAIEDNPRTKEALDRQKAAQLEVVREADNMVEATIKMMNEAMEIVMAGQPMPKLNTDKSPKQVERLTKEAFENRSSEDARQERMAQMNQQADLQVALEQAAAEDSSNKSKDMAELMAEMKAEMKEVQKAKEESDESEVAKMDSGKLSGDISGPPLLKGDQLDLLAGNVLHVANDRHGIPGTWMYVNSWYVIGPFPNPGRVNLRRKFAPESVVDLDASYPGRDGTVRWEFVQSRNRNTTYWWGGQRNDKAEVIPEPPKKIAGNEAAVKKYYEFGIWYAYTEVFLDQEADLWLAVGSDDRSDVWLNDVPVWASSNQLKQWNIGEGYRKVHFKRGRNRILARIENGHWEFGWSICISTSGERKEVVR